MARAIPTKIPDVIAVEPAVHGDDRGFLLETYSESTWQEFGIEGPFLQENHSRSTRKGTLRGLHFQTEPGQAKLVRCLRGAIVDVAVDLRGTPFQCAVLEKVAKIPFGETRTYAEMAELAGSPRAARAAGSALGANPIPVVVPCHRVLRGGGGLGGYAGGLDAKRMLLELEGALG